MTTNKKPSQSVPEDGFATQHSQQGEDERR